MKYVVFVARQGRQQAGSTGLAVGMLPTYSVPAYAGWYFEEFLRVEDRTMAGKVAGLALRDPEILAASVVEVPE